MIGKQPYCLRMRTRIEVLIVRELKVFQHCLAETLLMCNCTEFQNKFEEIIVL